LFTAEHLQAFTANNEYGSVLSIFPIITKHLHKSVYRSICQSSRYSHKICKKWCIAPKWTLRWLQPPVWLWVYAGVSGYVRSLLCAEPSPESFKYRLCRGSWHSENWQKLNWFIVFHISIWGGLKLCLVGLSPQKPPRGDGTGCVPHCLLVP